MLPREHNGQAGVHPRWIYDTLLHTIAATLTQYAADPKWLGGLGALTLVLHTWRQDLRTHMHVHALMACGVLAHDPQGRAFSQSPRRSPTFLFPVRALSQVLKARFIEALIVAQAEVTLRLDPQPVPAERAGCTQALQAKPLGVYAKTPLAGPAAVLDDLSRYTHRTAIGNEPLLEITGGAVRFRTPVNRQRGHHPREPAAHRSVTTLAGAEFVDRRMQHVVPAGVKRIRHYELLAPAAKAQRMASARALLAMPAANPAVTE